MTLPNTPLCADHDHRDPACRPIPAVEWPTVALGAGVLGLWMALTLAHQVVALWLLVPLAAWTIAWWGSFQHEVIHGHPTRNAAINDAAGALPLSLWLPYPLYRDSHRAHHRDERLTDPHDDPETWYWTAADWQRLGRLGRGLVTVQQTLAGRLLLGPFWVIGRFWWRQAKRLAAGDRAAWRVWSVHLALVALVIGWVSGVAGMSILDYVLIFVLPGTSLLLVRSFAEHRAAEDPAHRTAIVENSPVFGLLFLYNNLHVVHHDRPGIPWYRIPGYYRRNRDRLIAQNGGLVYDGYGAVLRRYLVALHHRPVHPLSGGHTSAAPIMAAESDIAPIGLAAA